MANIIPPKSSLNVKFAHQKTDESCGAACAEMVLDSIAVPHPDQLTLYELIHCFKTKDQGRNKENWASSPDGLQHVLNYYSKPNYHFKLYSNLSQSDIARRMVWTIFNYKTPCIALINSGYHWVVVYQYSLLGIAITDYKSILVRHLQGLYIQDPNDDAPSEGIVYYFDWIDNKQYPERRGYWQGEYVALCDPKRPGNKKNKNMSSNMKKRSAKESPGPMNEANVSKAAKPKDSNKSNKTEQKKSKNVNTQGSLPPDLPITRIKTPGPDHGLVDDKTARDYSIWHLRHDGFYDPTKFTRMMVNPGPGNPMLVRSLDSKKFWWIVPFIESDNKMGGLMRINAEDARFHEAKFAMYTDQPLSLTPLSKEQITKIVIGKYGKPKDKIVIEDILVWKPCVESYSMFKPFYKVKMGSRTAYVRIDGNVYPRLTQWKL